MNPKIALGLFSALALTVPQMAARAEPTQIEQKIQPGASITTDGGYCTLNWIYSGVGKRRGKTYAGTAAHCVSEVGEPVSLATGTFGDPVVTIGEVAFLPAGWDGTVGSDYDYAFIEVSRDNLDLVDPAMAGHPEIPTGMAKVSEARYQDMLQFSGHGVAAFATQPTREERQGVLTVTRDAHWFGIAPITQGDSGGPVADVTAGGKALGIVTTLSAGITDGQPTTSGGPMLEFILKDAAAQRFRLKLRSVT